MIKISEFTDITYTVTDQVSVITINRPDRYNALRGRTVDELIYAFRYAYVDKGVAAIVLTGAGTKAFCSGGDQKERNETGGYGETEMGMFEIERLHRVIREVPKPVIAAVNGFAIGGGHVLHVLCDVSLAASTAKFGQVGPRVGSFDAGFGTAYLARVVGEKRAREIWFFCDQYDAETAERWGLVNRVVEPDDLLPSQCSGVAKRPHSHRPHSRQSSIVSMLTPTTLSGFNPLHLTSWTFLLTPRKHKKVGRRSLKNDLLIFHRLGREICSLHILVTSGSSPPSPHLTHQRRLPAKFRSHRYTGYLPESGGAPNLGPGGGRRTVKGGGSRRGNRL